jgi:hypothetical protein
MWRQPRRTRRHPCSPGDRERKHRAFLGRTEKSEDQPVALLDRVPGVPHLVLERSAVRFVGLLQAVALRVGLPAMMAAADAVILDLTVIERGAAMAAAGVQQAGAAAAVTKQHEILAENAHFPGDIAGIGGKPDRMPVGGARVPPLACRGRPGEFQPP